MKPAMMVDIETFGTGTNAVMVQLGALVWDKDTGATIDGFLVDIDPDECVKAGATTTVETLEWWASLGGFKPWGTPVSPWVAIMNFQAFCVKHYGVEIWAKGTDFDLGIIKWYHEQFGASLPWKFYQARDLRTLLKLAQERGWSWEGNEPTHNALQDCVLQVNQFMCASRVLSNN